MTLTWLEVAVLICLSLGIVYCLVPLASNLLDLWAHRRHVRNVFREASRRRKADGDAVSPHWLRVHGYTRGQDGDAA